MLHTSVTEARNGEVQSQNYWHLAHCLDSMRQDALCEVDDVRLLPPPPPPPLPPPLQHHLILIVRTKTPRHLKVPPHGSTGNGLVRQCRDFEQFEAWARERTACYAFPTSEDFGEPLETHFRSCPEGSEYAPAVRRFFGPSEEGMSRKEGVGH